MLIRHIHSAARGIEARRRGCRLLPIWLILCSLALTASSAVAEPSTQPAPQSLRVISYNVWGVPHIAPERSERVAQIGERLVELSPDVVALQEVWLQEDASRLGAALARAGLSYHHHFGPDARHDKGAGLWLASRYPITQVRFVPFAAGQKVFIPWHVDYMANKGFALAEVLTPRGAVQVANTHMQSSYIFYHYRSVRLAQALQLAGGLVSASDAPLILAGDLNDTPSSLSFRTISARTGLSAASDDFGLDAVLLRSGQRLRTRVDEVRQLLTEPVMLPSGTRMPLSDHPCVVVDVALEGCDDCGAGARDWAATREELRGALDAAAEDTRMLLWSFRAGALGMLVLLVAMWRRRGRRFLPARVLLSTVLVMTAGWCTYAAWEWAPYKLELLAQQRRLLMADAGAQAAVSVPGEP